MANYYCSARTNYFRVTNEERYLELLNTLTSNEGEVFIFSEKPENGTLTHAFGADGMICCYHDGNEVDDFDWFLSELQKILPDDEAFILFEAGHEKLNYVNGYATIVTCNNIENISLENEAIKVAKKLLENENFKTETRY